MTPPPRGGEGRRAWAHRGRALLGWVLLVLGLVGLFLPVLQGWLLILAGLGLLSARSPWARRWLQSLRRASRLRRQRSSGGDDPPPGDGRR